MRRKREKLKLWWWDDDFKKLCHVQKWCHKLHWERKQNWGTERAEETAAGVEERRVCHRSGSEGNLGKRGCLVAFGCKESQLEPQPIAFVVVKLDFVSTKLPLHNHKLGPSLLHLPHKLNSSRRRLFAALAVPVSIIKNFINTKIHYFCSLKKKQNEFIVHWLV